MNNHLPKCFVAVLLVAFSPWLPAAEYAGDAGNVVVRQKTTKWALLFAAGDYVELQKLRFAQNDMQTLKRQLIAVGFPEDQVILLDDKAESSLRPCKLNFERELRSMMEKVRAGDQVIVAASSHGVTFAEKNYICPVETPRSEVENGPAAGNSSLISLAWVYEELAACKATQRCLLVDACRTKLLPTNRRGPSERDGRYGYLEKSPVGVWTLCSCDASEESLEDADLQHGVFMYYILQGLASKADIEGNGNGEVMLFELYNYASLHTKKHAREKFAATQIPKLFGTGENYVVATTLKATERSLVELKPAKPSPPPASPDPTDRISVLVQDLEARRQFQDALLIHKAAASATDRFGALLDAANEMAREAKKLMDDAIQAKSRNQRIRAAQLFARGKARLQLADRLFQALIETDPNHTEARLCRANVLRECGFLDEALAAYQAAGKPLRMNVTAADAPLSAGAEDRGKVQRGEQLEITKVQTEGGKKWYWVASVNDNDQRSGWIGVESIGWNAAFADSYYRPTSLAGWDSSQRRRIETAFEGSFSPADRALGAANVFERYERIRDIVGQSGISLPGAREIPYAGGILSQFLDN